MPIPSSNASPGQIPSTIVTPSWSPSKGSAKTVTDPLSLPMRTRSPSATPSLRQSPGWILARGRSSCFRPVGVSVKLELRKLRDGRGHQAEGAAFVGLVDDRVVVRKLGHPGMERTERGPVRREAEAPVGGREPGGEMALFEGRAAIDPALRAQRVGAAIPRSPEGPVDHLPGVDAEAFVLGAEAPGEPAQHVVVGARLAERLDGARAELEMGVAERDIEIVVFEEGRRRQHDIRHARGLGHELLVHADEQILAGKTPP